MPGLVQHLENEPVSDGEMAASTEGGIASNWKGRKREQQKRRGGRGSEERDGERGSKGVGEKRKMG